MSLKYWVWLSTLEGIGASAAMTLLRRFETPEQVFFARDDDYRRIPELKSSEIAALENKQLSNANRVLEKCEIGGYSLVTIQDAVYPERLRNIYDPPILLYVRGKLPILDEEPTVAIVGTRDCTPYGVTQSERMGYELARRGFVITTGLAKGIDTAAARGALRGGGKVVAVLGGGVDVVYPAENYSLYEDVGATGALISEYPPGTAAAGEHFPVRNRILSGISVGVIVIEAPFRSGALITASRALEQGRDVFALPANVDSVTSAGSLQLLRDGAIPLLASGDVVHEYIDLFPDKIDAGKRREMVPIDSAVEKKLLDSQIKDAKTRPDATKKGIDNAPAREYIDLNKLIETLPGNEKLVAIAIKDAGGSNAHVDDIIVRSGLTPGEALAALTVLQIKGYAVQSSGKYFSLESPE